MKRMRTKLFIVTALLFFAALSAANGQQGQGTAGAASRPDPEAGSFQPKQWSLTDCIGYALEQNIARLIPFDPDLFDYSRSGLKPDEIPKQLGFSGFNVLFHTNWADDRAVFQGASYFRAKLKADEDFTQGAQP